MISKIMKYKIRRSEFNEYIFWLREYIDNIRKKETGIHAYYAFRYDEQDFIHFIVFKDRAGQDDHNAAPHTKLFMERLHSACDDEPDINEVTFVNDPGKF